MAYRTPPIITPFAILSAVLALGATNVAVNTATGTVEGKPKVQSVSNATTSTSSSLFEESSSDSSSKKEDDRQKESKENQNSDDNTEDNSTTTTPTTGQTVGDSTTQSNRSYRQQTPATATQKVENQQSTPASQGNTDTQATAGQNSQPAQSNETANQ